MGAQAGLPARVRRHIGGIVTATYAWIITEDKLDPGDRSDVGTIGPRDVTAEQVDSLKSGDAAIRTRAIRRIAITPPIEERRADIVSRCETLLNDQSGDVRGAAAKALAHWSGKEAVPILAKRLEGFDPGNHALILEALAEVKDDAAAAAADQALDRGSRHGQRSVGETHNEECDEDAGNIVVDSKVALIRKPARYRMLK